MGRYDAGRSPSRSLRTEVSVAPPLSSRERADSRAACPVRSLAPERFRGTLPLRRPALAARGLSRTGASAKTQVYRAAARLEASPGPGCPSPGQFVLADGEQAVLGPDRG